MIFVYAFLGLFVLALVLEAFASSSLLRFVAGVLELLATTIFIGALLLGVLLVGGGLPL